MVTLLDGSRTVRYGATVSRNISSNLEVHAEVAQVTDVEKIIIDSDGGVTLDEHDATSVLAGIRYLAQTNTTWIVEYYRNGRGYTEKEIEEFFGFVEAAEDAQLMNVGPGLSEYMLPNPGRDYLYVKASQNEPFGWLYLTPALITILNAGDGSYNLIPEVSYTGVENLELRARLSVLAGADGTEYGEKLNDWKIELRVRYFF